MLLLPRCRGVLAAGRPCPAAAKYPEEKPEWCWNCDPTKREARAANGAKGGHPFATEKTPKAVKTGSTATVDRIAELCLEAGRAVRKGQIEPSAGHALSRLYGKALDCVKARATTGDAPGAAARHPKPAPNVVPAGDLETLQNILDA
jgi:hypothetical protein